jgi:hypothetical protein
MGAQMDSRIREIEQWVVEAKHDLGERGREAYLEKLYLLDAEIRNVIRENGVQPGAASPQPAARRVRRLHATPAFASPAAFGVLLLAVTAVYFASPGVGLPWVRSAAPEALLSAAPTAPTLPAGEELVDGSRLGVHHLTALPSSPSEEKAGEKTTPSDLQGPAAGAASTGNSKPTALAHASPQAPVASFANTAKPAAPGKPKLEAGEAKLVALNPDKPASKPAPKPLGKPAAQPAGEATSVIPVTLAANVNNSAVDNVDSDHKLDASALTSKLKESLGLSS